MSQQPVVPPMDDALQTLLRLAVDEDLGAGNRRADRTVQLAIAPELQAGAAIVARRAGVIAGAFLIEPLLSHYRDRGNVVCEVLISDAARVVPGDTVARLHGDAGAILSAERVLLNFLGHLSGIATLTRRYVDAVEAAVPAGLPRPAICDTRKTTPGFRALDKYAVRCGGGVNHRIGLYDGVMLKDNHLVALRRRLGAHLTLAQLTAQMRATLDPAITLWLEVDTLEQLAEALPGGGADVLLLDNFTPAQLRQAVRLRDSLRSDSAQSRPPVLLEASGGITLDSLAEVARTGVDRISIGALTHSAPVLDLSMELAGDAMPCRELGR